MDPDDLVSVYQAAHVTEAHLVKNMLLDEDIPAYVSEENEPLAGLPIVPPDVLVPKARVPQARAIIEEYEKEQIARAHRPDWVCPNCGATVVGAFDQCDACGTERPGTEDTETE